MSKKVSQVKRERKKTTNPSVERVFEESQSLDFGENDSENNNTQYIVREIVNTLYNILYRQ